MNSCSKCKYRIYPRAMSDSLLSLGLILLVLCSCHMILPLKVAWGWKVGASVILAIIAFKFHVLQWMSGSPMIFVPNLPIPIIWLFACLFVWLLLSALMFLVFDIVALIGVAVFWLWNHSLPLYEYRGKFSLVSLGIASFAMLLAIWGTVEGTRSPRVYTKNVYIKNLPAEAEGMTIAVLADLHVDTLTRAGRIESMVDDTLKLQPDIIVIAGDFADGPVQERAHDIEPLRKLKAPLGVYGCPGNHEYYSGYEEWMAYLPTLGIRMLINEHVELTDKHVIIAGTADGGGFRRRSYGEAPDIAKALQKNPQDSLQTDQCCIVLLAHQPSLARPAAYNGVDLQISGHTHGGAIMGVDRLIAELNDGFVSGFYQVGDMTLFVSNGSGIWNGFPFRLGVPSEIVLLRLTRQSNP